MTSMPVMATCHLHFPRASSHDNLGEAEESFFASFADEVREAMEGR